MATKLRWGILGTGNIARQFATGLIASRRGTLTAVGSRTRQSAEAFAQSFPVPQFYGSYQELIHSDDVDIVYNSLPNSLHCHWTIQSLRAGKHVLCEKPLALDAAEAQRMFEEADKAKRVLMEAFMYRSHPLTLAITQAVKAGAIGQLKLIRTSFCFRTRKTEGNVRFVRELGGGGLMDIGCYCINFSRLFAAEEPTVIQVSATMHATGVDDLAGGTMVFPSGVIASFSCGMSVQADNTAYLCGSEGFIEIPVPWKPPAHQARYIITRGIPPRMDAGAATAGAIGAPPPRDIHTIDAATDLYGVEADDFVSSILDSHPLRITREDSIGNMRVLDEMRKQIGLSF